jgi:hypothetical protein
MGLGETVLIAMAAGALWWWISERRRWREPPEAMQPGERWRIVETRSISGGAAWLVYSGDDDRWGVYTHWEDGRQPLVAWRSSESEARKAFEETAGRPAPENSN